MRLARSARALPLALSAILAVAACAASPASPQGSHTRHTSTIGAVPAEVATYADVPYVDDGTSAHRLDLWLPSTPRGAVGFPVVIYIHGGAWAFGDKAMSGRAGYGLLRDTLTRHGWAVASVNYRFVAAARFPAQSYDVKAATRYLRANAAKLGLDATRFVAMGDSAGGHLAQLLGLSEGVPALEGTVGTTGVSSAVAAVVSYYGVSDLVRIFADRADAGCGATRSPATSAEAKLFGGDPTTTAREEARLASPITYARSARVPVLLFHGTRDCIVPAAQSVDLHAALGAAGVSSQLRLIPAGHADPVFFEDPGLQGTLTAFLDRYAGPR